MNILLWTFDSRSLFLSNAPTRYFRRFKKNQKQIFFLNSRNIPYVLLNNTMVQPPPPNKQSIDKRIVYFNDQVLLEEGATLEEQN